MEIVETTQPTSIRLSEQFLAPYRKKGDPFKSLLARSTYLTKYCRDGESWTDTIRRVVEGNIKLAPGVSLAEAELLFHLFWTGQAMPPGRGLWTGGVEAIPADARYNCFSGETRFWADGTLVSFEEAVGQSVEVLAKDGAYRPASVRSFGVQKLLRYRLKPPGRTNFAFEFVATANHRWFTSNRGEVTDLKVGDRVRVTPTPVEDLVTSDHDQALYDDGFAHGFVFGDGSPRDLKGLPPDDLGLSYLAGFLAGWMAADGSIRSSGRGGNRLASQNGLALDWAVERAPLLGFCVSGRSMDPSTETNFGPRSSRLEILTLVPEPMEYTVREVIDEGREEGVYCVTEPVTGGFTLEGGVVTGNCWYTTLYGIDDWCWTANQLMLGGGVGVGLSDINTMPRVVDNRARFAVWCRDDHPNHRDVRPEGPEFLNGSTDKYVCEDSREGWVTSLRKVLDSAFEGKDLVIDVSSVRPRGAPIRTFGGTACGPGPLTHLLRSSWELVRKAAGRQLTSVECLDITNHIGLCIKAGNVRRSALIVLGHAQDRDFRNAKKDWEAVASHRHTSNNSIAFHSWGQLEDFNWAELVEDNIEFGEPGILNLPLGRRTDPEAKGVNPCFAGDTLVAVADGRNAVPIKELTEAGEDVPVYSMDRATGKIEIKMARHPRVTGYNKKLVRVWLDDGSYLDVTPNHGFLLRDTGEWVEAKDLKRGDSLPRFTKALECVKKGGKDYYRIYCNTRSPQKDKTFEHRMIARFHFPDEWERVYSECKVDGFAKTGGLVVHHRDYDQLNNAPDNLQIMSFKAHTQLHGDVDNSGECNGRWSGVTNAELREKALEFTRQLGQRFSQVDWQSWAKSRSLPAQFSEYRTAELGTVAELAKWCATELGLEHQDEDPRVVKTLALMLRQGYRARIVLGGVVVEKTCEVCGGHFEVAHGFRERAFCSEPCGNAYVNSSRAVHAKRVQGMNMHYGARQAVVMEEQARICSQLQFELRRDPNRKEWSLACKADGVASRIGPTLKHGFRRFKDVLEAGSNYNHKVLRVEELPGEHTVYNLTVDDHHTVATITSTRMKRGGSWFSGVISTQCGEQLLHDREACNLAEVFPAQFEPGTDPVTVFRLITRYCLRQRLTPLSDPKSHEVGQRNMRIGVGLGGVCDFDWTPELLAKWFGVCRREADDYADELGVNRPLTVTTVKPSGTISLLNGSSPGIHAPHARYYIRRIRIAKNDPMAPAMMEAGVTFEEDQYDQSGQTWVFAFPMESQGRVTKDDDTLRAQFERQVTIQEWWADNAVSATLNFDPETEKQQLASCLEEFVPRLKSTSLLPKEHSYVQAPYEAIDEHTYREMAAVIDHDNPLTIGGDIEIEECAGGACPIR
jgi:ribonucleotide reductase alpha subunit